MPPPRKKSCGQCREAKTRCDLDIPRCKRCLSRGFRCDYTEARPPRRGADQTPWSRAAELPAFFTEPGLEFFESTTSTELVQGGSSQGMKNIEDIEGPMMDTNWNTELLDFESTRPMLQSGGESPRNLSIIPHESENSEWRDGYINPLSIEHGRNLQETLTPRNAGTFEEFLQLGGWISTRNPSTVKSPSSSVWPALSAPKVMPLLFSQRKPPSIGQSLGYNHLLRRLVSYPDMLLSGVSLPPFIHTHTYCTLGQSKCSCASTSVHRSFPTPLANCISIMHMWQTRTPESNALVWRTIMSEQQRLHSEYHQYDNANLLSALQAITVYILLQAREKEHEEHACIALILTMSDISTKVYTTFGYLSESESNSIMPLWEEWVFRESLRRTVMVLFLINLLVDIKIDYWAVEDDCSGVMGAYLPCSEDLWESSDREGWEAKYKHFLEKKQSQEMLQFGMLKASQQLEKGTSGTAWAKDLKAWSSRVDSLGAVVMMAALTAGD